MILPEYTQRSSTPGLHSPDLVRLLIGVLDSPDSGYGTQDNRLIDELIAIGQCAKHATRDLFDSKTTSYFGDFPLNPFLSVSAQNEMNVDDYAPSLDG